jgi:hypothetical protein
MYMIYKHAFINVRLNVSINILILVNDFITRVLFMYVHLNI